MNIIFTLVSSEEIHILQKNIVTEITSLDMFGIKFAQKRKLKTKFNNNKKAPVVYFNTGYTTFSAVFNVLYSFECIFFFLN